MRIILYTGKGGVGKTSVAAATACKIASSGKRVLIVSTDQAHSLSDSFDVKLGNQPIEVAQNLFGMEIDTTFENEKSWGNLKKYIEKLMVLKSEDSIENEELLVFPGFDELLSLIKIKEIYDEGKYDVLIVDCAPTGETMSLLKFPDIFKWWMEKIFPIKRKGAKIARPLIQSTIKIPMPSDETFDDIERLYCKIADLHSLMINKDEVSVRIVTTAEKVVVKEAKRSFSYLHLFDYNVDAVIINKIFPEESLDGYFNKWAELQKHSIQDINESFRGVPIFKVELLQQELRKFNTLFDAGKKIYCDIQPEQVLFNEKIFSTNKTENGYALSINMPFVDKAELGLSQIEDEITITVKNEKRVIVLPNKFKSKQIMAAEYKDEKLIIHFS